MAESRRNDRSLWSTIALLFGSGLLLLCALVGFALSFLSLYPLEIDAFSLLPQAVIFALAALAAWSLPRYALGVSGGLTALWALNVFLNWQSFTQGALLTCSAVADLFAERVGWTAPMNYSSDLTAVAQKEASLVFLTLAMALLALALGWTVVRARCWWLVVLLTLPPLMPALLADVYPDWPGFMALAACWCAMLLTALCQWSEHRGALTLTALMATAALLAALTALFPMEGYARPQWALDAERAIVDFGNYWLPQLRELGGPFHDNSPQPAQAQPVNLSEAGPLSFTGRTVLRVTAGETGHYYLRGSSLDVYTGDAWEPFPEEIYQEYLDSISDPFLTPDPDRKLTPWDGSPLLFLGEASQGQRFTVTVDHVGTDDGYVFLPYQLVDQNWDEAGVCPVRDSLFSGNEDAWSYTVTLTNYNRDLAALIDHLDGDSSTTYMYNSDSSVHVSSDDLSEDGVLGPLTGKTALAERLCRDYVYAHYLDVPESAQSAVMDVLLAHFITRATYHSSLSSYTLAELTDFIPDALATWCTYDQNTPAVPEGEDFVSYFLTESHQGYCMHFASAGVLMFRSLGVPARYVSGYTVDVQADRTTSVPDFAAHAWVEIYVDGWGWYPVEVTPGFSDEFDPDNLPDNSLPPDEEFTLPPETEPPVPSASVAPSQAPVESEPPTDQESGFDWSAVLDVVSHIARWLAAIALTAITGWLVQLLLKRRRRKHLTAPDTNRAVLDGYRYLSQMKHWGGRVSPEAKALAEKAMYSQHTLTEEERQSMISWFNSERKRLWMRLYGFRRFTFLYLWGGPDKP